MTITSERQVVGRSTESPTLDHLDLNLLRVFDALRVERSVSRAARRLGLTQSGASRALARLREALADPLFIPGNDSLLLTPYAESIADCVSGALGVLASGIARSEFHPNQSERRFAISMSDYSEALLLPPLTRCLDRDGPGIRLEVTSCSADAQRATAEGALDLSVVVCTPDMPRLRFRNLLQDKFVAVARRDHPTFSLHALPREGDEKLAEMVVFACVPDSAPTQVGGPAIGLRGMHAAPRIQSRNVLASALLAAQTDRIVILPRLLAQHLERYAMLRILPVPFDLGGFHLCMYWHERFQTDPGHRWLRSVVHAAAMNLAA